MIKAVRFQSNPLIIPEMLPGLDGNNINGPSLIKVPDWIVDPLGKYYLYFAHHRGTYIRMAYADRLAGPWTVHAPGVLSQRETAFGDGPVGIEHWYTHIASPDVVVDQHERKLTMYFHGMGPNLPGCHCSSIAVSENGLNFKSLPDVPVIEETYLRAFQWNNEQYLIGRLGRLYKSSGGLNNYEKGPNPFEELNSDGQLRHAAVMTTGRTLRVFYSRIGDRPERIVMSNIELSPDWNSWKASSPVTILTPEMIYEGVGLITKKSRTGWAKRKVRQLRDPGIYQEGGSCFLLYTIMGESGIAMARLIID